MNSIAAEKKSDCSLFFTKLADATPASVNLQATHKEIEDFRPNVILAKELENSAKKIASYEEAKQILEDAKALDPTLYSYKGRSFVGKLKEPIIVYHKKGDFRFQKKIESTYSSLYSVTGNDIAIRVEGNDLKIGLSTTYADKASTAAASNAGFLMGPYTHLHVLRIEAGTEVIVTNFNDENEILVANSENVKLLYTYFMSDENKLYNMEDFWNRVGIDNLRLP